MLPKSERLKDRRTFNIVFSLGKKKNQKIHSPLLSLYYLFRTKDINTLSNQQNPQVAFIVGLKIDKRATKRNLIKRRMRVAYRTISRNTVNLIRGKYQALVWIANISINSATFKEIKLSMEMMLAKLNKFERPRFINK